MSGEAAATEEEEENQQVEMRSVQPNAVCLQSVRAGIRRQGPPRLRPVLQHVQLHY